MSGLKIYKVCPKCKGNGRITNADNDYVTCPDCCGKGDTDEVLFILRV